MLLDKSAIQALGPETVRVQSEYFYTMVAPVVVWEICGNIEKLRLGEINEERVRALARKAKPLNSIVSADWRKMCLGELLGMGRVRVGSGGSRVPLVDGGHLVPIGDGKYGHVLDHQPEAQALLQWSFGEWTAEHRQYARRWREVTRSINLEVFRHRFGPAKRTDGTVEEVSEVVNRVLRDPSLQVYLLDLVLAEIGVSQSTMLRVRRRWISPGGPAWSVAAPYAHYCARTILTFYLSLAWRIINVNPTNRVDLEYLFYLPFTPIFVSGDEKSHGRLAPMLMEADQEYVRERDFREALEAVVQQRKDVLPTSPPIGARDSRYPADDSLISKLWMKAWGRLPRERSAPPITDRTPHTPGALAEQFRQAMAFVDAHPERYRKRPRWPQG